MTPLLDSFEELREQINAALSKKFNASSEALPSKDSYSNPSLEATFEDRIIFCGGRYYNGAYSRKLFQCGYTRNEKTGEVTLGEPEEVKLTVAELSESLLEEGGIPSYNLALQDPRARKAFVISSYNMVG